jgi:hypothetical protein
MEVKQGRSNKSTPANTAWEQQKSPIHQQSAQRMCKPQPQNLSPSKPQRQGQTGMSRPCSRDMVNPPLVQISQAVYLIVTIIAKCAKSGFAVNSLFLRVWGENAKAADCRYKFMQISRL